MKSLEKYVGLSLFVIGVITTIFVISEVFLTIIYKILIHL